MALTFEQLITPKTIDQVRQQLLDGLQGRGVVTKAGTGLGSLTVSGAPSGAYSVVVEIVTAGELGVATMRTSTNGGATFGAPVVTPLSGTYPLSGTGVTLQLVPRVTTADWSFIAGDRYIFETTVPSAIASAWQAGSVPRTLVEIDAQAIADLTSLVAAIARSGFVTDQPGITGADGGWLDMVAQAVYGLTRQAAVAAVVQVVLTDAGGAGPFTIVAGQLWVAATSSLGTSSPKRFTNVAGGVLAKNGTLTLAFQAESPGGAWNVGDSTITTLQTSLPGVTVNNPGPASLTTSGNDTESDQALSTRCVGRWASLGTGSPAAAYDTWARTASSDVTRTKVAASGTVGGQVDLWLAGAAGGVTGGTVAIVVAAITPKMPLGSTLNALSATATPITITAWVFIYTAFLDAAQAACELALQALIATTPIGGTVYLSAIIDALQSVPGVRNVSLTAPTADTVLTSAQVATLAGTRFYSGV
jgi:uncharacterized phage protein gp47/JayE